MSATLEDEDIALLQAWDRMDRAAQNVSTALPHQMSERIVELDRARVKMREVAQRVARAIDQHTQQKAQ